MSLFTKRVSLKPYEYPFCLKFVESLQQSYWLVEEFSFISDIQDFKTKLTDIEKNAIKNALLAISQIEVAVKKYWTKLGDRFPKSEFEAVGVCFGNSELIHQQAYSKLLEILDLNQDFELLLENPVIKGRVDYLQKYLKNSSEASNEVYTLTLTLFALFIENVSLFSQFAIIKAFNKHKNVLKDIDNVVSSTFREETLHALFGVYLVNLIKQEFPQWFNEEFYIQIDKAAKKSYLAEEKIIDWIFEKGEMDFLSKDSLKEFIKYRFNDSIKMIGGSEVFKIDNDKLKELNWFIEEIDSELSVDFFHKVPSTYSKRKQPVKAENLF